MIQPKKKFCDGTCGEERVIWKNYQGKKYCKQCWSCHEGNVKQKPTVKQTPIPLRSAKRAKEERLYSAKRIIFLGEHPMCEMHIPGICTHKATTVQHLRGRTGDLLLDETEWMAACWPCHSYADTHPEEAIANGWAKLRIN